MVPSAIPVYRPLATISPQVARHPRVLPDFGRHTDSCVNTVLDPRILKHGGIVDLTHVFSAVSGAPAGVRRIYVPRHLPLQGTPNASNGTRMLSPLQSAYNEMIRAAHDPDPGVTNVQRRIICAGLIRNLQRIAAQDFRQTALTETVRFRVPGAFNVCVADERLMAGEIGLSPRAVRKMFGGKEFTPAALVGRYPTFRYLPARVVCLEDIGDSVAVSPSWIDIREVEPVARTFLDLLEGDCDGDMLAIIPATDAECASEILSSVELGHPVPHKSMPMPGLADMIKSVGNHFESAMAKAASKEYIRFIISSLYRSWIVFNLCNRFGVSAGLSRGEITGFWKAVCEGVFDLKHDADGVSAAEEILLCFRGDRRYSEIVGHIAAIEKMPADGLRIGRLLWEMPYRLGLAAGKPIRLGDLNSAAELCPTWSVLQDMDDGLELVNGISDLTNRFGASGLGSQMLTDIYEEVHE